LPTPPAFDAPVAGARLNIATNGLEWKKIQWCGYPTVKRMLKMCLFVSTEYTNVTDRWTPHDDGIGRAYA